MTLNRRSLITGLISLAVTAPAIVRAGSLMPVKVMEEQLSITELDRLFQALLNDAERRTRPAVIWRGFNEDVLIRTGWVGDKIEIQQIPASEWMATGETEWR